ncbi:glycine-rich protein DOT1-like [Strongylocentrotus purpuratus]|uniref:Uncharacterized protein n=1 Tax=Strongylocentrotus purpuratus TaxID=7668 RepID=A0A7M7P607_STRPU|nr:glycine-rich protein DOT1-like [Strongylocentrotus purpuratus]
MANNGEADDMEPNAASRIAARRRERAAASGSGEGGEEGAAGGASGGRPERKKREKKAGGAGGGGAKGGKGGRFGKKREKRRGTGIVVLDDEEGGDEGEKQEANGNGASHNGNDHGVSYYDLSLYTYKCLINLVKNKLDVTLRMYSQYGKLWFLKSCIRLLSTIDLQNLSCKQNHLSG